jgi:uncharacterized membrane protein
MLQELSDWLTQTPLNTVFSDTTRIETWLIIPVSQTVHILGVAVVMTAVGMLNLQLLGVRVTKQSFADLSARWMPWVWSAMVVLFITGAVQTIAEPTRELMNNTFRIKVVMLLIAIAITVVYRAQVKKDAKYWERSGERRALGYALASVSLVLWLGIVAAGRLIAYVGAIEEF